MNILHTMTIFPKLSETFVSDLILRLIKLGHPCSMLSRYRQKNLQPAQRDTLIHQAILDANLGTSTYYFPEMVRKDRNRYRVQPSFRTLLSSIDVIVAHFADLPTEIAMNLAQQFKKPFVFFAHAREIFVAPDFPSLKHKLFAARFIVVPTEYNRHYLLDRLGTQFSDKIRIVRYGIDLDCFQPLPLPVSRDVVTICTVGRLVEKKGVEYTLRAFARAHSLLPFIRLKVIGEGVLKTELKRLAEELRIANQVDFSGEKDHLQIRHELAYSDIFMLPSITAQNGDREGLPVSILEAMAMQLPIISSTHTGVPEAVVDGQNGFLCAEKDVDSLSQKLIELVVNKQLRMRMGRAGRITIEKMFNQEHETKQFVQLLNQCIKKA